MALLARSMVQGSASFNRPDRQLPLTWQGFPVPTMNSNDSSHGNADVWLMVTTVPWSAEAVGRVGRFIRQVLDP